MPDDRDFFDSVALQARFPRPANDNLPPLPIRVALTLALMLLLGAIGLTITLLKIVGLM